MGFGPKESEEPPSFIYRSPILEEEKITRIRNLKIGLSTLAATALIGCLIAPKLKDLAYELDSKPETPEARLKYEAKREAEWLNNNPEKVNFIYNARSFEDAIKGLNSELEKNYYTTPKTIIGIISSLAANKNSLNWVKANDPDFIKHPKKSDELLVMIDSTGKELIVLIGGKPGHWTAATNIWDLGNNPTSIDYHNKLMAYFGRSFKEKSAQVDFRIETL